MSPIALKFSLVSVTLIFLLWELGATGIERRYNSLLILAPEGRQMKSRMRTNVYLG